jgi:hypothetical protein
MQPPLERYDAFEGPKFLEYLWTLVREPFIIRCRLSTHREGWRLRLTGGPASFFRTQVCKTEPEVFDTSEAWRTDALHAGWASA